MDRINILADFFKCFKAISEEERIKIGKHAVYYFLTHGGLEEVLKEFEYAKISLADELPPDAETETEAEADPANINLERRKAVRLSNPDSAIEFAEIVLGKPLPAYFAAEQSSCSAETDTACITAIMPENEEPKETEPNKSADLNAELIEADKDLKESTPESNTEQQDATSDSPLDTSAPADTAENAENSENPQSSTTVDEDLTPQKSAEVVDLTVESTSSPSLESNDASKSVFTLSKSLKDSIAAYVNKNKIVTRKKATVGNSAICMSKAMKDSIVVKSIITGVKKPIGGSLPADSELLGEENAVISTGVPPPQQSSNTSQNIESSTTTASMTSFIVVDEVGATNTKMQQQSSAANPSGGGNKPKGVNAGRVNNAGAKKMPRKKRNRSRRFRRLAAETQKNLQQQNSKPQPLTGAPNANLIPVANTTRRPDNHKNRRVVTFLAKKNNLAKFQLPVKVLRNKNLLPWIVPSPHNQLVIPIANPNMFLKNPQQQKKKKKANNNKFAAAKNNLNSLLLKPITSVGSNLQLPALLTGAGNNNSATVMGITNDPQNPVINVPVKITPRGKLVNNNNRKADMWSAVAINRNDVGTIWAEKLKRENSMPSATKRKMERPSSTAINETSGIWAVTDIDRSMPSWSAKTKQRNSDPWSNLSAERNLTSWASHHNQERSGIVAPPSTSWRNNIDHREMGNMPSWVSQDLGVGAPSWLTAASPVDRNRPMPPSWSNDRNLSTWFATTTTMTNLRDPYPPVPDEDRILPKNRSFANEMNFDTGSSDNVSNMYQKPSYFNIRDRLSGPSFNNWDSSAVVPPGRSAGCAHSPGSDGGGGGNLFYRRARCDSTTLTEYSLEDTTKLKSSSVATARNRYSPNASDIKNRELERYGALPPVGSSSQNPEIIRRTPVSFPGVSSHHNQNIGSMNVSAQGSSTGGIYQDSNRRFIPDLEVFRFYNMGRKAS